MALDLGTETIALSAQERTWRVELFCEPDTEYTVRVHRHVIKRDGDNVIRVNEPASSITRSLGQLSEQSFSAAGATATGAQLAALIAVAADWMAQDEKARLAALESAN